MDSEAEAGVVLAARQLAEESTIMCDTLPVLSENETDKHTDIGLQPPVPCAHDPAWQQHVHLQ